VTPGRHHTTAQRLTGGATFPVLVLDGRAIGDSTRIIAELERLRPDPPLYPQDPAERRRALELEDFFDEELGPHTRVLVVAHLLPDADLFLGTFASDLRGVRRAGARLAFPRLRRGIAAEFGLDDERIALAFRKVQAAGERFRAELQDGAHLVDGRFTVADLTLASLVAPIVAPPQFPYPQPQRDHPRLAPVREALAAHGLDDWAREIYTRYRSPSAELDGAGRR